MALEACLNTMLEIKSLEAILDVTSTLDEYKANINSLDISVNYTLAKKKLLLVIAEWENLLQNLACKYTEENSVSNNEANITDITKLTAKERILKQMQ